MDRIVITIKLIFVKHHYLLSTPLLCSNPKIKLTLKISKMVKQKPKVQQQQQRKQWFNNFHYDVYIDAHTLQNGRSAVTLAFVQAVESILVAFASAVRERHATVVSRVKVPAFELSTAWAGLRWLRADIYSQSNL